MIGIVAEYNPFHNGHKYQIDWIKKNFPNEKIVVVMSGKFSQRGELCVANFEQRKKIALESGVDEVHKMDPLIVNQAAHVFANEAICQLNKLGINKLVFGSESNDVDNMIYLAELLQNHKKDYKIELKKSLKQGNSFPKSASNALKFISNKEVTLPNDILGFEYVKSILKNKFDIEPISIKRTVEFHSEKPNNKFASATFLRKMIYKGENISKYSPMIFTKIPDRIENYYQSFQNIIRNTPASEIAKIKLVSEGIENRLKKFIDEKTYFYFINKVNSKRYTSSRIKRIILNILLKYDNVL